LPTSIAALLIILIAVFPGLIGNRIYRIIIGVDWREKEIGLILRLMAFSVMGLVLYYVCSIFFNLPPPLHLFPDTYSTLTYNSIKYGTRNINDIFIPYIGHIIGGTLAGFIGAYGNKLLARFASISAYPAAWDEFARKCIVGRWVVIGLNSGEIYAGKIKHIDISIASTDRDIILEEPCQFDETKNQYIANSYQYMFIPASNICSIAALHDPSKEGRSIPIGTNLFSQGGTNE